MKRPWLMRSAGLPDHRAHPNRVRAYAQASGHLAKTDRLDAQALARYGAAFERSPGNRRTGPARAVLQDLLRRPTGEAASAERVPKRSLRRHIAWLDDEIAQLEAEYPATLASVPERAGRRPLDG